MWQLPRSVDERKLLSGLRSLCCMQLASFRLLKRLLAACVPPERSRQTPACRFAKHAQLASIPTWIAPSVLCVVKAHLAAPCKPSASSVLAAKFQSLNATDVLTVLVSCPVAPCHPRIPCNIDELAGKYSDDGRTECLACPLGTYQDQSTQATCKACSACNPGQFSKHALFSYCSSLTDQLCRSGLWGCLEWKLYQLRWRHLPGRASLRH
jgi:hypothetical protein